MVAIHLLPSSGIREIPVSAQAESESDYSWNSASSSGNIDLNAPLNKQDIWSIKVVLKDFGLVLFITVPV